MGLFMNLNPFKKPSMSNEPTPTKIYPPPKFVELSNVESGNVIKQFEDLNRLIYDNRFNDRSTYYKSRKNMLENTEYAVFNGKWYMYLGKLVDKKYEYSTTIGAGVNFYFENRPTGINLNYTSLYKVTNFPDGYDVRSFNPTDKKIICVFWKDNFCKLANVDSKNVLSLQCNDGIHYVNIDGTEVDSQGGKKNKKRTTKRLSKNKRNKTRKYKKSRR